MAQPQQQDPPMVIIQQGQLDRLGTVVQLMGAQNAQTALEPYRGDPKKFNSWVKSIEKYLLVINGDKESMKTFALQSSEGSVSDFLLRYYQDHPACDWAEVHGELKSRFAEVLDTQHALQILRMTRQKTGETIPVYAERLIRAADDVWPDADMQDPLVEQQMVGIFTDGLLDNAVARKVIREGPADFQAAVQLAMKEEKLSRRFELRHRTGPKFGQKRSSRPMTSDYSKQTDRQDRQEEPMEVDAFHGKCFKCGRRGHRAVDCRTKTKTVHEVTARQNQITCFKCGQVGHGIAKCQNRGSPQTGRCWQCGQQGHKQAQCKGRQQYGTSADWSAEGSSQQAQSNCNTLA